MTARSRLHPSGVLEIEVVVHRVGSPADVAGLTAALTDGFAQLRVASGRDAVARLGRDQGYRVEDVVALSASGIPEEHVAHARAWLARRLPSRASVAIASGPAHSSSSAASSDAAPPGALSLRASIEPRAPEHARAYEVDPSDGRVAVESVELHVVEHCNLRCAQCCNISPYLAARTMSVDEVRDACARIRSALRPDVLKIMGGEPLLHPDLGGVLRAVRQSGVAPRVRLFTNGLLLRTLDDATFSAIDELTVSSYASAPVRHDILAETEARAARFDVVLNVKGVSTFSTVLTSAVNDDDAVRAVYDACWLRHRCLVVRGGRFYKCTRAAYHREFHARVARGEGGARDADDAHEAPVAEREAPEASLGVSLDAPDFAARAAAYLSAREPLASCRRCLGSSGPLAPHVQLRRADVARGALAPEVRS